MLNFRKCIISRFDYRLPEYLRNLIIHTQSEVIYYFVVSCLESAYESLFKLTILNLYAFLYHSLTTHYCIPI